jgi:zinc protease
MKKFSAFVVIFLCAIPAFVFSQSFDLSKPLPFDTAVTMGKLDNGITYYIRVNKKPEHRAELRLVVNAGSMLEDEDQRGLAHLIEHMAFRGTKRFKKKELINFLESSGMRFGPDVNAYTSFDETVFMLQLPTDTASILEKGIQILADWSHAVNFDSDDVTKERQVVIEEWRLGRGANARLLDKTFPVIFKDSRYAVRLPIGDVNILRTFKLETLKRFYNKWYRPDLMAVIVVGDFDKDVIEQLIKTEFNKVPRPSNNIERPLYPVGDHAEPLFTVATDSEATISNVTVYDKHAVEDQATHGDYRRTLVQNLYSSMLNERLGELARKPDPPFIYGATGNERIVRTKEAYIMESGVKDSGVIRGLQTLLTEAARVRQHGFTATELERQKNELLRSMESYYLERDKTESDNYADEYIRNFLEQEPSPGVPYEYSLYKAFVPSITLDEVNALSNLWMNDSNRVVVATGPAKLSASMPSVDELKSVFEAARNQQVPAYVDTVSDLPLVQNPPTAGTILDEHERKDVGIVEWQLSNGIHVVLKPTDFKNDEIQFNGFAPGGSSTVADSDFVPAATATSIVDQSGIASFDLVTLEKKLAGKLVSVSPSISELEEGISGNSSVKDLETMFQLIYLYFTAPRSDSAAYLSYISRLKAILENRSANPQSAFEDTIEVTMAQHHPRRQPWSNALLEKMSLDRSFKIYKNLFGEAGDFTFVFVGSFKTDDIKPLVLKYIASLPNLHENRHWSDVGIRPPKGKIEKSVARGIEPKSSVRLIFTGPFDWTLQNRYQISSMASVLSIKLREAMREDKGGTYGVGVNPSVERYPIPEYRFTISFGCAPERVDELIKTAWEQIDSIKQFGIGDLYITKVKEMELRERETSLKENGFWLSNLKSCFDNKEDPGRILTYPERVASLSSSMVQKSAQKYLDTSNCVRVVLYPAKSDTTK